MRPAWGELLSLSEPMTSAWLMADAPQWPQARGRGETVLPASSLLLPLPQVLLTLLPKGIHHPIFLPPSPATILSWLEVHSGLQIGLSASLLSFPNPFSLQKPEKP